MFLIFIFFAISVVSVILKFIFENIGMILLGLSFTGVIVGIVVSRKRSIEKKEVEDTEKQKNIAIVNAEEPLPNLTTIASDSSFSNKEEEAVNLAFREFLKHNNDMIIAREHLNYLSNKGKALRALGRDEEAAQLDNEIAEANAKVFGITAKKASTFESKFLSILCRSNEIKSTYASFIHEIPNERLPIIGDFFQNPLIKISKLGTGSALIFTPCYLLLYSGTDQNIRLIQYKDVSVSTRITGELLNGNKLYNDEIEHIGYRYETKNGDRDMRYSYSNNPSYTFVYRGEATIHCGDISCIQKFTNKSLTEDFEKQFNKFLRMVNGKYKNIIRLILGHNEKLERIDNLDTFIGQLNTAEKVRIAAEKEEAKKKYNERKMQEAALAEKQKKEKEEREAAEREKRRQAEFMKKLTIVDGTLRNWRGSDRHFELPEGLVTIIGDAFKWKNNLETVSLPNGIIEIQANAFYGSKEIRKITIPSSVSSIGKEAFCGCSSLSEIVLPKSLNTISAQMFGKCSSLKTITVPTGVKTIARKAFSGCSSLTEIVIPEGVTIIEDDAFENCTELKNVVLPNSISTFGKNVFSGCTSLEHVTLGTGIKRIPNDCFNNLQKLIDITVASDVIEIGDRAFRNCHKLTSIFFVENNKTSMDKGIDSERMIVDANGIALDSLERIGKSAFENCFVFKGIDLKEGLRTISEYAFANCRAIRNIYLPKSIKTVGRRAFTGCTSLKEVIGSENVKWQKKNCFTGSPWLASQSIDGFVVCDDYLEAYTGKDSTVEIPSNVRSIGRSSFEGNAYVSNIKIPYGVVSIEELAFANCRKLKMVSISDSVTHIEDNAFEGSMQFVIQCTRGSAASAYRIRNKLPCEYISKAKAESKERSTAKKSRRSVGDGLSGLSEEELRIIMEMRREKIAKKKAEEEKPNIPETIEYVFAQFDVDKVEVKFINDGRKITNNIFNMRFEQVESVGEKKPAEYETFIIDAFGKIISDIKMICANKEGPDLTHKVTYSLSAQEKFDKSAKYYVILRYKNAGLNILSKNQCQISIDFASDFDF